MPCTPSSRITITPNFSHCENDFAALNLQPTRRRPNSILWDDSIPPNLRSPERTTVATVGLSHFLSPRFLFLVPPRLSRHTTTARRTIVAAVWSDREIFDVLNSEGPRTDIILAELGLAEKNILNYDFDTVASDPSDANTNSATLFSDDADEKSRKRAEARASTNQEDEMSERIMF
ncbi:two-component response regulator-like APRR1 [Forsythia ovata]|uniref:Two-component response regulator-like APRR1 n=1 Tax=Forsythia ovata TaxID=205694 RepID=A0ABD1TU32_9LAMI